LTGSEGSEFRIRIKNCLRVENRGPECFAGADKWLLKDPGKSIKNTVIDYGEEEFTQGRPHPTIEPGVRNSAILKEASDPETAVILLDFVLTPPGPKDPAKAAIAEVKKAQELVRARGGELAVVASVCGTNSDIQNAEKQEDALREAGVFVCSSNFKAALLAGKIIQYRNGGVANE
jgi:FdrA protein